MMMLGLSFLILFAKRFSNSLEASLFLYESLKYFSDALPKLMQRMEKGENCGNILSRN